MNNTWLSPLARAFAGLSLVLQTACFVEPVTDRSPGSPGYGVTEPGTTNNKSEHSTDGDAFFAEQNDQCLVSLGSGCIDGFLPAGLNIAVEDEVFHDADDFSSGFGDLLLDRSSKSADQFTEGLEFRLITPMGNQAFARGFNYVLMGDVVRSGMVAANGAFKIEGLTQGTYQLRIQKPITFEMKAPADFLEEFTQVTDQDGTTAPSSQDEGVSSQAAEVNSAGFITRSLCATVFSERTIVIRSGQRVQSILDDFELRVMDRTCPTGIAGLELP